MGSFYVFKAVEIQAIMVETIRASITVAATIADIEAPIRGEHRYKFS